MTTTRRVVVAMMEHETNTFSPVPTPLTRFARGGGELLLEFEFPLQELAVVRGALVEDGDLG